MPKKYHISTMPAPPRFTPISKFCSIELDGCTGCVDCVKRASCVYDVYRKRKFDPDFLMDTGDAMCVNCLRCVQECKRNRLSRSKNPMFERLGNDYWKPDLILSLQNQAHTGKIPVSGAGYRGPFTGPGFDRMWTDMSEIVRPTRDGIHGREYISTLVEVGRKPKRLKFDENGNLVGELPFFLEIPLPIVFDLPALKFVSESTKNAVATAVSRLGNYFFTSLKDYKALPENLRGYCAVKLDSNSEDLASEAKFFELSWSQDVLEKFSRIKQKNGKSVGAVRIKLDENALPRALELAGEGVDVLHLEADFDGKGFGESSHKFVMELVREIHLALVKESLREQVTLIAKGGIAMAEHVAKIIICGADLACLDFPILIALECRLCRNCDSVDRCPVEVDKIPVKWGAQRIVNLMGSWHSQLIEVLGAMGLREVRRLRGEVGRAMFFEDLEREIFAPIFGERIAEALF